MGLSPYRRRRLTALAILALVAFGAGAALYAYQHRRPGDVFHPNARFVLETPPPAPPARGRTRVDWPLYGYNKAHTRYFPAATDLRPPFVGRWILHGGALLEFPPVIAGGTIYQLNDNAELVAVAKKTGTVRFRLRLGGLSASTPAAGAKAVYVTVLERGSGNRKGRVVAVSQHDGHVIWTRDLPSRSESSPLLDGGNLYLGSENGTVYALRASDGQPRWTYHGHGAVKASPTLRDGMLFFGDYGDHVQAVRESDGHRLWLSSNGGGVFGGGSFYATPAVIYGRVYLGNTDGRMYAFDQRSGRLDWAKQTGAYVYSSPAVNDTPGVGPTVYFGSYDGTFYALDAQSGRVRWAYHAGGRISGSPTIVGDIVYFADLGRRETIGLSARYGNRVWSKNSGSFDPVVSDGHWIFLTGYTGLYALEPRAQFVAERSPQHQAPAKPPAPPNPTSTSVKPAPAPVNPTPSQVAGVASAAVALIPILQLPVPFSLNGQLPLATLTSTPPARAAVPTLRVPAPAAPTPAPARTPRPTARAPGGPLGRLGPIAP